MRKKSTTFESLQELAKDKQQQQQQQKQVHSSVGEEMADLAKLQEMFAGAYNPEVMAAMGDDLNKAMEELMKMDPEELQKSIEEALKLMTQTDSMVDNIMDKKDQVLSSLETSGMVSQEELEKFKKDPAYFESQMRDAFDQMKGIFSDPEVIKTAAETMKGIQEAFSDPAIADLAKLLEEGLADDTKIEEARLELLSDPSLAGNELIGGLFKEGEFQEILQDPKKWREAVKEGQAVFKQPKGVGAAAGNVGAGVGEL